MLFNSFEFLLFLPAVFAAYWILNLWTERLRGLQAQNLLLLIASYVFYGWWDWRFLSLIAFSTVVDYAVGIQIAKANAWLGRVPNFIPNGCQHRQRLPTTQTKTLQTCLRPH